MSQRLFSFLTMIVLFVLVGVYAAANGLIDFHIGDLFGADFVTTLTPFIFVLTTLSTFFDVIDSKVADGTLPAGDIGRLIQMSEFYVAMVTILSGALQIFGLRVLDEETQTLIVNAALLAVTLLFRSFTDRTPTQRLTVAQKVERTS
jgi:hypothetical protein